MNYFLLAAALSAAALFPAAAETVTCPANRDVWLSSYSKEANCNMGAAPRLKLKIYQEFALVDFDVSALRGRSIRGATLYVKPAGGHKFGLNGGLTDLSWLVLSTVSHDWVEGKSAGYAEDPTGHGATFLESSFGRRDWGRPGATVCDVTLGNGNTLRRGARLKPAARDGWLSAEIDPDLVRALVADASHGLLLMDGATYVIVNCFIASRESGDGPYLEVDLGEDDRSAPGAPVGLRVEADPQSSTVASGSAAIRWRAPAGAFAYRVLVNGEALPRYEIPFAGDAGAEEVIRVESPAEGGSLDVRVEAVGRTGMASPAAAVRGKGSAAVSLPAWPREPSASGPGALFRSGNMIFWAFPEVMKIDPVSGEVLHEAFEGDVRASNAVWDGASRTVALSAARGEIVSFQVGVQGDLLRGTVAMSELQGPGVIPGGGIRLWRNWYVGRESELALPMQGNFSCPSPDNDIPGQTVQAVTVDVHVPSGTPPGEYRGTLWVGQQEAPATFDVRMRVYGAVIPDDIHFNPELNCYGGPGEAGGEKFIDSHRLAHYHRCNLNRLPYSHRGRVHEDWAPLVDARGRVTDWSRFDQRLAGLLDGSWFADNPRSGVPVAAMYLPIHEGWPLSYLDHYAPGEGIPMDPANAEALLKHDALAKPVDEALSTEFGDAFRRCTRDFYEHFRAKGWNRTLVECYLNAKPQFGYCVWTLDEPVKYRDWDAINYFARLFKEAVGNPDPYAEAWHRGLYERGLSGIASDRPLFLFRGDISRPQWQGSQCDGLMNYMVVNNDVFRYPRIVADRRRRMPATVIVYGSCNEVGRSNWESAAWCLKAFAFGCDGVLPWQSVAGGGALREPDTNGLIVDAGPYGHAVASFRVHALRRGAQDCELLRLLQLKRGWSRDQTGMLLARKLDLGTEFNQAFADEAAAVKFRALRSADMLALKEGILQLLEE